MGGLHDGGQAFGEGFGATLGFGGGELRGQPFRCRGALSLGAGLEVGEAASVVDARATG